MALTTEPVVSGRRGLRDVFAGSARRADVASGRRDGRPLIDRAAPVLDDRGAALDRCPLPPPEANRSSTRSLARRILVTDVLAILARRGRGAPREVSVGRRQHGRPGRHSLPRADGDHRRRLAARAGLVRQPRRQDDRLRLGRVPAGDQLHARRLRAARDRVLPLQAGPAAQLPADHDAGRAWRAAGLPLHAGGGGCIASATPAGTWRRSSPSGTSRRSPSCCATCAARRAPATRSSACASASAGTRSPRTAPSLLEIDGVPVLGGLDDVADIARRTARRRRGDHRDGRLSARSAVRRLSWELEDTDTELILAPALTNIAGPRVHTQPVEGLPLIHVDAPDLPRREQVPQEVVRRRRQRCC